MKIEDKIKVTLKDDAQKNLLELVAHIRALDKSGQFPITQNEENDDSGWVAANLGFIVITGTDDFPGPWSMWIGANNIADDQASDCLKELAWKHVSPCGSCGGDCSPGVDTKIFGKNFEKTCQANLMFTNPDVETVDGMKKIIDVLAATHKA